MFDDMNMAFESMMDSVISFFPKSPFQEALSQVSSVDSQWLGWLNWFFPVSEILTIMSIWLVAVGSYYTYSVVARWLKIIGG